MQYLSMLMQMALLILVIAFIVVVVQLVIILTDLRQVTRRVRQVAQSFQIMDYLMDGEDLKHVAKKVRKAIFGLIEFIANHISRLVGGGEKKDA
jgi:uncharacterized protein YoxC